MQAVVRPHQAIGVGSPTRVVGNRGRPRIRPKIDAHLLVIAGRQLLPDTQRSQKAVAVGLAHQVHLLRRRRESRRQIDKTGIICRRICIRARLHVRNGDIHVAEWASGRLAGCRIADHNGNRRSVGSNRRSNWIGNR